MRAWLAILFSLLATAAVAGFSDFGLSGFSLSGGTCSNVAQIPVLTVTPSSYAFGTVTTGSTRVARFTLSNTGKGSFTNLSTNKVAGIFRTYSTADCEAATLTSNTCRFNIAYTPTAAVLSNYSSRVYTDQYAAATVIPISGTGVEGNAAPSYVQSVSVYSGADQTITVGAGNLLVAIASTNTADLSGTSVSDTKSNVWTAIDQDTASSRYIRAFYAMNVAGGSTTISIATFGGDRAWTIYEFSGVATTSAYIGKSSATTSGTVIDSGNVTITGNAVLIGYLFDNASAATVTWNNSFSAGPANMGHVDASGYRVVNGAGTYSANLTRGASSSSMLLGAYAFKGP